MTERKTNPPLPGAKTTEANFQAFLDAAPDAMVIANRDGNIVLVNARTERMFGYTRQELLARKVENLMPERFRAAHPGQRADFFAGGKMRPMGSALELYGARKDGTEFPIDISLSLIEAEGGTLALSALRDMTDLKRAQGALARAKEAAENANRELEAFSYSVAHDLRAPLRSIDGFSQALLEDYSDKLDATGRAHLKRVRESAQRMAQLIEDLLMLARVTQSELRRDQVDLSQLARSTVARLHGAQPDREVDVRIADGLAAHGDSRLLAIAIENLLSNAWKFTAKCPLARIEMGRTPVDGRVVYFVRDNGAGFDMAYASKLFGVFQRLHSAGEFEGTGIGLATVQRIVRRHGGRIWAQGEVDRGAAFYFTLAERRRRS
jgi:PAS domain S-box-containing protein